MDIILFTIFKDYRKRRHGKQIQQGDDLIAIGHQKTTDLSPIQWNLFCVGDYGQSTKGSQILETWEITSH